MSIFSGDGRFTSRVACRSFAPASHQIPATVEIIDQNKIREQGYRTTTEVAQGSVGVTAGDGPGEPGACKW